MRTITLQIFILFILSLLETYFVPELFSVALTPLFVFSFLTACLLFWKDDTALYLAIISGLFLDFLKMTTPGFTSFLYVVTLLVLSILYKRLIKNPLIILILFSVIVFFENIYIFLHTQISVDLAIGATISGIIATLWLLIFRKLSSYV